MLNDFSSIKIPHTFGKLKNSKGGWTGAKLPHGRWAICKIRKGLFTAWTNKNKKVDGS